MPKFEQGLNLAVYRADSKLAIAAVAIVTVTFQAWSVLCPSLPLIFHGLQNAFG